MTKGFTRATTIILSLVLILTLAACGQEPVVDPHEGMIYVNTGGAYNWLYPQDFPAADYKEEDFSSDGTIVTYTGTDYEARLGVDVSFYQGDIDWEAVCDAGVEFAMIRCGFRGSSEGVMYEDEKFHQNMEGAIAAGLDVGVYFFSQTTGAREAAEEAEFVLNLIEPYDISMPVAFDWEELADSRAQDISSEDLTTSAMIFCEIVADAGYEPAVYLYRKQGYYDYDLTKLADYTLWIGSPGEWPDFYYEHSLWQFSFTARIPGIDADVDLNLEFDRITPLQSPSPSPEA